MFYLSFAKSWIVAELSAITKRSINNNVAPGGTIGDALRGPAAPSDGRNPEYIIKDVRLDARPTQLMDAVELRHSADKEAVPGQCRRRHAHFIERIFVE